MILTQINDFISNEMTYIKNNIKGIETKISINKEMSSQYNNNKDQLRIPFETHVHSEFLINNSKKNQTTQTKQNILKNIGIQIRTSQANSSTQCKIDNDSDDEGKKPYLNYKSDKNFHYAESKINENYRVLKSNRTIQKNLKYNNLKTVKMCPLIDNETQTNANDISSSTLKTSSSGSYIQSESEKEETQVSDEILNEQQPSKKKRVETGSIQSKKHDDKKSSKNNKHKKISINNHVHIKDINNSLNNKISNQNKEAPITYNEPESLNTKQPYFELNNKLSNIENQIGKLSLFRTPQENKDKTENNEVITSGQLIEKSVKFFEDNIQKNLEKSTSGKKSSTKKSSTVIILELTNLKIITPKINLHIYNLNLLSLRRK